VYVCPGDSFNIPLGGNTDPRGTEETLVQDVSPSVIASSPSNEYLVLDFIAVVFNVSLKFPLSSDCLNTQVRLSELEEG
jgi:hypothetical protein